MLWKIERFLGYVVTEIFVKMNSPIFRYIIIVSIGALIALYVTFSLFTGDGNKIGGFFRYITALGVIISLWQPRMGILLLIASSGYLDMVKRFTLLDSSVSQIDIASVLVFAPLLVAGMTLNTILSWMTRGINQDTKLEMKIFIVCLLWAGLSMIPVIAGSGLRTAGNALNYFAYVFLFLQVPRYFKDPLFVKKSIVTLVVAYIPVMALALHEGNYGYNKITMDYLLSGYTGQIRQLADARPGAMSTLAGPPGLSLMMSLIGVYLILPFSFSGKFAFIRRGVFVSVPLAILFFIAAYYTFARTGWVVGFIFLGVVTVLYMNKAVIYLCGFTGVGLLGVLYLSAGYLVENDTMHVFEERIRGNEYTDAGRQTTSLGTFNGRLASMNQVVSDPEMWTPFGFKLSDKKVSDLRYPVHEGVGNLLVRIGYIPFTLLAIGGFLFVRKTLNLNSRLKNGAMTHQIRVFSALGIACLATAIGHGQTMFSFPINVLWALAFSMALGIYLKMNEEKESEKMSLQDSGEDLSVLPNEIATV